MPNGYEHESRIERLEKNMFHGNGKPGITTRMQQAEDALETHTKSISDIKKMFWGIILLLLTILGGTVADLARGQHEAHQISTSF